MRVVPRTNLIMCIFWLRCSSRSAVALLLTRMCCVDMGKPCRWNRPVEEAPCRSGELDIIPDLMRMVGQRQDQGQIARQHPVCGSSHAQHEGGARACGHSMRGG